MWGQEHESQSSHYMLWLQVLNSRVNTTDRHLNYGSHSRLPFGFSSLKQSRGQFQRQEQICRDAHQQVECEWENVQVPGRSTSAAQPGFTKRGEWEASMKTTKVLPSL